MDRYEITTGIFLHNNGALYLPERGLAAVSDLHIGYEAAAMEDGSPLPGSQKPILMEKIEDILSAFPVETLVITGDLKHNFDRNLSQEWDDVLEMVDYITSVCKLVVLRGNHDNYLSSILRRYGIPLEKQYMDRDICFVHGHKSVSWEGSIVMGHEHPSIGLMDQVGGRLRLPCFLISKNQGVLDRVVLPAASPLAYGADVLRASKFLSPMLQNIPLEDITIWATSDIGLLSFGELARLRNALIYQ